MTILGTFPGVGYTTGEGERLKPIHFINLGHSKEHVIKAVESLDIQKMVIFTSPLVKEGSGEFLERLEGLGVEIVEVFVVDPFLQDSLRDTVRSLLRAHRKYSNGGRVEVVSGLTGGTNIMAIAMGIFSMLKGLRCHYVVSPPDDRVMEIALFEGIVGSMSIDELVERFEGDDDEQ